MSFVQTISKTQRWSDKSNTYEASLKRYLTAVLHGT